MKIRVLIGKIIYDCFAKHLPASSSWIKVGQKQIRRFCGKLILEKCGKKVNIEKGASFSSECELGDFSGIGINARISGKVKIGKHVMMGPGCSIYAINHKHDRTDIPMDSQGVEPQTQPVVIEDDVWIGANSIILSGITIGSGSIIGAGTVVTKNVPKYSIFCGNPGRVVRIRKE